MFKAIIIVCMINTECVELHDKRGPYKTQVECMARSAEMMQDFVSEESTPPVVTLEVQCNIEKGTAA
jgi:hypothetical protein